MKVRDKNNVSKRDFCWRRRLLNNKFKTFLNKEGPFFALIFVGGHVFEAQFWGEFA